MNKKGFTLIELLAVIVILAVIALIATPQILGVIETARKGSAESSALGFVDAVEKQVMLNEVDSSKASKRFRLNAVYKYSVADLKTYFGVEVKGKYPKAGEVIIGKDGSVLEANIQVNDDYYVNYDASKQTDQASATKTTAAVVSLTTSDVTAVSGYYNS